MGFDSDGFLDVEYAMFDRYIRFAVSLPVIWLRRNVRKAARD
jgi:hypothetical protein